MNRRGVTIIELLMTIIIGSIAVLAMWPPFVAERLLWNKGKRQTEAQRDAQMGLRAIARSGRESRSYEVTNPAPDEIQVRFFKFIDECFIGTPTSQGGIGRLVFNPGCEFGAAGIVLIDGVRSRVEEFIPSPVPGNPKLAQIHLVVSHRLRTTDNRSENEVLDTTLFLRN